MDGTQAVQKGHVPVEKGGKFPHQHGGDKGAQSDAPQGVEEVKVLNQSGTELPSTGGMGTTIFYVLGSILVIGAVVLLVTKKRMNAVDR